MEGRAVHSIGEVEDIDGVNEAKLTDLGIRTTDDLLARAATPGGRTELAGALGVTDREILKWANCADLMRVDGIGMQFADLLEEAGVDTIPELAQRNAGNLHARVVAVNTERQLSGRAPTAQEVERWIDQARSMPRILQYGSSPASDAMSTSGNDTSTTIADTSSSTADTSSSIADTSSSIADTSPASSLADTSSSSIAESPASIADTTADDIAASTSAADTSTTSSIADTSSSSSMDDTSGSSASADTSAADSTTSSPTADSTISNADRAREAASATAETARSAASTAADTAGAAARSSAGMASSAATSGGGFLQRLMNRLRGR
jgi:hypothetical protein